MSPDGLSEVQHSMPSLQVPCYPFCFQPVWFSHPFIPVTDFKPYFSAYHYLSPGPSFRGVLAPKLAREDPNVLLSLFTSSWFLPWNKKGFSTPWSRTPNLQRWNHLRTQDSSLPQTLRLILFRVRSLFKNPEVWHDLPRGQSLYDLTSFSVRTSLTTQLQVAHISLPWHSSSFCFFSRALITI